MTYQHWEILKAATSVIWAVLGPLVGVCIGAYVANRNQTRHWIADNKKLEWRTLIDELHDCMEATGLAFRFKGFLEDARELPDERVKISKGVVRGSQIISNRLFIEDILRRHEIHKKWQALADMTTRDVSDQEKRTRAARDFVNTFATLHDELTNLAREDLLSVR